MDEVPIPTVAEPAEWFVLFHTKAFNRWFSLIALGRFKHVSAIGYYPGFKAWIVYDVQFSRTQLVLIARDAAARATLARYTAGCTMVKIARRDGWSPLWSRFGFFCVPAIKHLLGVRSCALRPDALYAHLIRNGGIAIDGRDGRPDHANADPGADAAG